LLVALCLGGIVFAGVANVSAQVAVNPTVSFNLSTGVYTYSYSVFNGTNNSLAIISFGASPSGPTTVQNLTAPTGFFATYDSGNGFISFLEDSSPGTPQMFAPGSTVAPFTLTSMFAPGATSFQALDIFGNTFTGVTQAPIPEPGVFALAALAIPGFAVLLYRRRAIRRLTPAS
jgi:hypothetical protein